MFLILKVRSQTNSVANFKKNSGFKINEKMISASVFSYNIQKHFSTKNAKLILGLTVLKRLYVNLKVIFKNGGYCAID